MDFSDLSLARTDAPGETHQAPPSLLAGLNRRIEAYRQASFSNASDLEANAQAWEQRCAMAARGNEQALARALRDEDYTVRHTAARALGDLKTDSALALLEQALQDEAWQVREMALLTIGEQRLPLSAAALQAALQDSSDAVRQAALYARARLAVVQDSAEGVRKDALPHGARLLTGRVSSGQARSRIGKSPQRAFSLARAGLLAACLVLLLGVLSAAGYGLGWWSPLLGSSTHYTTINQEQTLHGATVRLIKAYADEGRVILVYDTLNVTYEKLFLTPTGLASAFPARPGKATGGGGYTEIDAQNPLLRHSFAVYDPLEVPATVETIELTWKLELTSLDDPAVKRAPTLEATFTFTFTLPFHHENRQDITLPYGVNA